MNKTNENKQYFSDSFISLESKPGGKMQKENDFFDDDVDRAVVKNDNSLDLIRDVKKRLKMLGNTADVMAAVESVKRIRRIKTKEGKIRSKEASREKKRKRRAEKAARKVNR